MEMNTPNANTLCVLLFMCTGMTGFGLLTLHNGGINFKEMVKVLEVAQVNEKEGLKIVKGTEKYVGIFWIELNGEVIHGGFNRIQAAEAKLADYQKIYDAGVRKGISQK